MTEDLGKKGFTFEDDVEQILIDNNIINKRHKPVHGYGKKWIVDFYLPKTETIIECKNIACRNLQRELMKECIKFLDIRNRFLQMNFVLLFPKPSFTMTSFVKFCNLYKINLDHQKKIWLEQENHLEDFHIWISETFHKHNPDPFADLRESAKEEPKKKVNKKTTNDTYKN